MGGTRENEEEGGGRGTQDQPESWGRSAHPSSRRGLPHPVWVPSLPLQVPSTPGAPLRSPRPRLGSGAAHEAFHSHSCSSSATLLSRRPRNWGL